MKTIDGLAREHTERAIEVVREVLDDPFAENRDRLKAAEQILDRGHGKPNQAIIAIPGNRQIATQLAGLTDDQLLELLNRHELPRLAPIDATFTEVVDPLLE